MNDIKETFTIEEIHTMSTKIINLFKASGYTPKGMDQMLDCIIEVHKKALSDVEGE